MKKIIWYSLLLGATFLAPVQGTDVGKLLPVEVVQLYKEADTVIIATDAGPTGSGTTVDEAVADMKATAPGIVFLDTADHLLIKDLSDEEVGALGKYLKPSVRVCNQIGQVDPEEAAAFLRVHKPQQRLKDRKGGNAAQALTAENGKMMLKDN